MNDQHYQKVKVPRSQKIVLAMKKTQFAEKSDKVLIGISQDTRKTIREFLLEDRSQSHNPMLQLSLELSAIFCSLDYKQQNYLARIIKFI